MEIISVLGWICSFSSIAVQFVGIEICIRIWKKGSTGDISPAPFVANLIAAGLWVKYGLLTSIQSLIIVNALGAILALIYVIFFYIYSIRKSLISRFMVFGCLNCNKCAISVHWSVPGGSEPCNRASGENVCFHDHHKLRSSSCLIV